MANNWDRGILNAQALEIGDMARQHAQLDQEAGEVVKVLGDQIFDLIEKQKPYQDFLERKAKGKDVQESLEIFGAVRPDLIDKDASLGTKRVANLKLFAWSEWFQQTLYGQSKLGENKAPILRGLSDQLSKSDGKIENPERAISALNDIAARMEFSVPMKSGVDWVEDRIHQMAETVEWKKDDPTIPIGASIEQVVPNLIDWEKRTGEKHDPFEDNLYGIKMMAVR